MLIELSDVRRNIQKIIELDQAASNSSSESSLGMLVEQLELLQTTVSALKDIKFELGEYFNSYYGIKAMASNGKLSKEIVQLFEQVYVRHKHWINQLLNKPCSSQLMTQSFRWWRATQEDYWKNLLKTPPQGQYLL